MSHATGTNNVIGAMRCAYRTLLVLKPTPVHLGQKIGTNWETGF